MAHRRIAVLPVVLAAAISLAGCATAAPPTPSGTAPSATATDSAPDTAAPTAPATAAAGIPEPAADVLLRVAGTVTAPNGATAEFAVDLHEPVAAASAAGKSALLSWCAGEVDASMFESQGLTIAQVDVRFAPTGGSWPADLELGVLPIVANGIGNPAYLVVTDGLVQYDPGTEGGATPHCVQPAKAAGLASGEYLFVGSADASGTAGHPPLTEWTRWDFGLTSYLWSTSGTLPDSGVRFSDCTTRLSTAGQAMMSPDTVSWSQLFSDVECAAGGGQGELGIGD